MKVKRGVVAAERRENRFFSQADRWIATKLAHDASQTGLHPECAQGQGRGQTP